MGSTLWRLFRYAKGDIDALENFTTEALAQAIRADAKPFLDAVRRVETRVPSGDDLRVRAVTQVSVRDAGILDLVVSVESPSDIVDVWVEVKRNAEETGNQLANYARVIARRDERFRPVLVVLGPRHIEKSAEVPWIAWQEVWRLAKGRPAWTDFRTFLGEPIRYRDHHPRGDRAG